MTYTYGLAFNRLVEGAKWVCRGNPDDYKAYEWLDDRTKPTKASCDALIPSILEERAHKEVEQARQVAYQLEADPLFFKAQAGEDGITLSDWEAKRAEIKDRYPYPVL